MATPTYMAMISETDMRIDELLSAISFCLISKDAAGFSWNPSSEMSRNGRNSSKTGWADCHIHSRLVEVSR